MTGAATGTGLTIAETFAQHGYGVVITSRTAEKAQAAAEEVGKKYGVFAKGYVYQTSTLDEREVKAIFEL